MCKERPCCYGRYLRTVHLLPQPVNYDVSTAKNLLLLAISQEEQQKWVSRLVKKIPKKPPAPAAPEHFARSSPRASMKVQPSQSMRRPSRQLPTSKSRWDHRRSQGGFSLVLFLYMYVRPTWYTGIYLLTLHTAFFVSESPKGFSTQTRNEEGSV